MSIQTPHKHSERAPSPPATLLELTTGCWISQAIYVAAKLGIADLLKDGPKFCHQLAEAAQADPGALRRLLRLLASTGVFLESSDGRFELTPVAECLRSDGPFPMRAWAIMMGEDWHWKMWGDLLHSVRTGKPAFDHVHGVRPFEYFPAHPEAARVFDEAMTSLSTSEVGAILAAYDFSKYKRIIDIGGGNGSLITAVLKRNPETTAVLFDLPHVIERTKGWVESEGVGQRLELVGGNIFQSVPPGGDLYMMKHILHDFDDREARAILRNCRGAMSGGTRLLIIGMVIPPGNEPDFGKLVDLEMMLIGGIERTEAEHRALLNEAGFEMTRILPTASPIAIVESVPA